MATILEWSLDPDLTLPKLVLELVVVIDSERFQNTLGKKQVWNKPIVSSAGVSKWTQIAVLITIWKLIFKNGRVWLTQL